MIPCLYDSKETAFTTNGIGKLPDTLSATVTEKRNGSYELKLTHPADGLHAEDLLEGNIILAKPSEKANPQPFTIYKTSRPINGVLEISARHIQYRQNYMTVSPFSATGCAAAMAGLKSNCTTDCPFTFWTDIDSDASFLLSSPATVRNCLGGMEGSLLDVYGGEYEWDMFETCLHTKRGSDHGVRIVYGKNLVDFTMEKSIGNVITGVHPYWKHSEDGTIVQLPERVVTVKDHGYPYEKISVLDCTSQFEEMPTVEQLRAYAESYLKDTSLTEPDIDIDIDFVQLWQKPGYEDIAEAERVSLCDTVHVYIDKLGVEVSCKVTETEYDVLLERYSRITLSNASVYSKNSSLSSSLGSISDQAAMATEAINRVQTEATDTRAYVVQQEYYNQLMAGLLGLHYGSGLEDDGSAVRYGFLGESVSASPYAWKQNSSGFFYSTDGGATWTYGWKDAEHAVKLAVEAVGLSVDAFQSGTIKTALVKILGTDQFYWSGGSIVMLAPGDSKKQIRIGQYGAEKEKKYGIAVSKDGGETWTEAVGFDGVNGVGETVNNYYTTVEGEKITKTTEAPEKPEADDLWIDKSMSPMRLKIYDGTAWQIVGYEQEETEPTGPDDTDTGDTDTDGTDTDETDPDSPADDSDSTESDNQDNTETDNTETDNPETDNTDNTQTDNTDTETADKDQAGEGGNA